jgi:uncharacterized membrane protein
MRIQEIHPALVHLPIAFLPTSLLSDTLGKVFGSPWLRELGRNTMPLAAASSLLAGVFGFAAQEAVLLDDEAEDLLVTHRNLNLGLVGLAIWMARHRLATTRPSTAYLVGGWLGAGVLTYTAYLGGKLVYTHGVGVETAGGVNHETAPEIAMDRFADAARATLRNTAAALRRTITDAGRGRLVPALTVARNMERAPRFEGQAVPEPADLPAVH